MKIHILYNSIITILVGFLSFILLCNDTPVKSTGVSYFEQSNYNNEINNYIEATENLIDDVVANCENFNDVIAEKDSYYEYQNAYYNITQSGCKVKYRVLIFFDLLKKADRAICPLFV